MALSDQGKPLQKANNGKYRKRITNDSMECEAGRLEVLKCNQYLIYECSTSVHKLFIVS